jgi:hypothetical protein
MKVQNSGEPDDEHEISSHNQIYIVIHSMDIGPLKSDEAQELLSELATIK